ncbi:MAG: DUF4214 domain-containing protein [Sulfitobacter sp.]
MDDVYRLYRSTLDRAPDVGGLEYWATQLAEGHPIGMAAAGFANSQEFQNVYGALGDADFVRLLYRNVLDRDPDANGLADWTDRLAGGTTRGDVVVGFSQSTEFKTNTEVALASWVTGQGWDDVLGGGAGENVLFGGMWADRFVFDASIGGQHTIADLEAWDQLVFEGFGYDTVAQVRGYFRQDGEDVVFTDQGVEIRVLDVDLDFLQDDSLFEI